MKYRNHYWWLSPLLILFVWIRLRKLTRRTAQMVRVEFRNIFIRFEKRFALRIHLLLMKSQSLSCLHLTASLNFLHHQFLDVLLEIIKLFFSVIPLSSACFSIMVTQRINHDNLTMRYFRSRVLLASDTPRNRGIVQCFSILSWLAKGWLPSTSWSELCIYLMFTLSEEARNTYISCFEFNMQLNNSIPQYFVVHVRIF